MAVVREQVSQITEDELLRRSIDQNVEVVNGEFVVMAPVGLRHVRLDFHAAKLLDRFVEDHKLGYIFPDSLIYVLLKNEEGGIEVSRVPDISFVRRGRIPKGFDQTRPFPGAPDLAIEIVSPSEEPDDTLDKIRDYLAYGSEQVWVMYPRQQEIHQHRRDDPKTIRVYTGNDVIDAESLLPGFSIPVSAFFDLPEIE
jgi:Uma2 family endonuclease